MTKYFSLDRRSPSEPLCGTSLFYFILFYFSAVVLCSATEPH